MVIHYDRILLKNSTAIRCVLLKNFLVHHALGNVSIIFVIGECVPFSVCVLIHVTYGKDITHTLTPQNNLFSRTRSQISTRDLEMAMAELDELENRFKLRIEHGSSLPFPSRFSDRFRNSRHDIEHANFLRAGSYLFNHKQHHGAGQTLEHENFQASQRHMMDSFGNAADANLQLALLQNFVTSQNQLGLSVSAQGANCPNNDSYQNRYQLPNHADSSHFRSNSRNTNLNFFDSRQQQHTQIQSQLLSALLNSQTSGYNSIGGMK